MKLYKKNIKLTIIVISLLLMATASTYALFSKDLGNINLNSKVKTLGIQYSKGTDFLNGTINPSTEKSESMSMSITLWKNITEKVYGEISIDVKEIGPGLAAKFLKWEIWTGSTKLNADNFEGKKNGDKFQIHTEELESTAKTFKVYVWLDKELLDDFNISNKAIKLTVTAKANQLEYDQVLQIWDGTTNRPNLVDGMIPIKYDGINWVKANKANISNDWYDYNNKKWANAVMVKDTGTRTRAEYMSASINTVIQETDILAYLVWIPRYKYQLFNTAFAAITAKEIQIEFEQNISTTGTVLCSTSNLGVEKCTNKNNFAWYTHPAFTFGSKQLTGIWVGKFETTGDATIPTVKPNVTSLREQNVSTQFATSQKFNSTTYVTSTGVTKIDSHMMKNIEWGAVAYLTQSKYGRCTSGTCTEVTINNSSGYYTGRAGSTPSDITTSTTGTYTYETTGGQLASTTGNIYGIYDMSGGAGEYVMGVMSDTSGNLLYSLTKFNIDTMPESKYYDKYEYGIVYYDQKSSGVSHLGDTLRETGGWNNDSVTLISANFPWYYRGGNYSDGISAGMFNSFYNSGSDVFSLTFRVVVPSV